MSTKDYVASVSNAAVSPNVPHEPMTINLANVERVRAKIAALKVRMILERQP